MLRDPAGLAYLGAAVVFACLAGLSWRRRSTSPTLTTSFAVVMLAGLLWSAALTVAAAASNETVTSIALLATLPGPSVMGAALVCLGCAVVRPLWVPSRRIVVALLIGPALIAVAGGYVSAGVGLALLACGWWTGPRKLRLQRLATLAAALVPAVVHRILLTNGFAPPVHPAVLGFALVGIVLAYAISRREPSTVAPVARRLIVEQIGDAIIALSPTGRVLDLNPAAAALVRGIRPDAPAELIGKTDRELFGRRFEGSFAQTEVALDLPGGRREFHVRGSQLVDRRERALGMVYVARDVTQANEQTRRLSSANTQLVLQVETIERLRADLVQLANRDALTGLHNRRYLVDRFGPMIAAASRSGSPLAVVLLDVDRFKAINDEHGHLAGDKVLVSIAQRLRELAPSNALVARWGGEEFFIALPGADVATGLAFAEEARHRCETHGITVSGRTIHCTLSGGVAGYPHAGETVSELFHAADVAMYEAKDAGRNVVRSTVTAAVPDEDLDAALG